MKPDDQSDYVLVNYFTLHKCIGTGFKWADVIVKFELYYHDVHHMYKIFIISADL